MSETVYMRISTKHIACTQRQMHTCVFLHIMSIQPANKAVKQTDRQTDRDRQRQTDRQTDRQRHRETGTERDRQTDR